MRMVIIVKSLPATNDELGLSGTNIDLLNQLAFVLTEVFSMEGVDVADMFQGIDRGEAHTAQILGQLMGFRKVKSVPSISDEEPFRKYRDTVQAIKNHFWDEPPDALLVVGHGEICRYLPTLLSAKGADTKPIGEPDIATIVRLH